MPLGVRDVVLMTGAVVRGILLNGVTLAGTALTLSPPREPTLVTGLITVGLTPVTVTAPIERIDDSVGSCE